MFRDQVLPIVAVAMLGLIIAACGAPSAIAPSAGAPPGTEGPAREATPAVAGATAAATSVGGVPAGGGTVQVRDHPTLGRILTDSDGRTLYKYDADSRGVSNCTGECAVNWPPLQATGQASGPSDISGDLGTFPRPEGGRQVSYKGTPLYLFTRDSEAGETKGDGVGGLWHVVSPS